MRKCSRYSGSCGISDCGLQIALVSGEGDSRITRDCGLKLPRKPASRAGWDAMMQRNARIDSLQVNWSIVEGQKSAVRGQRLEVRGQRLEVRGQRIEVRRQKSEGIFPLSPCHLVPLSLTQNDTMRNGRCLPLSPCHLVPLSLTQSGNAKWALPSLVPHVP